MYHTPKGTVSTKVINEEMRNAGVSITWVQEHGIKRPEDYEIWAYIFENIPLPRITTVTRSPTKTTSATMELP